MPRPDSVPGLALRLLWLRGVRLRHVALGAAVAAGLLGVARAVAPPRAASPDVPSPLRAAFEALPPDGSARTAFEPALVATSDGWLAAWTVWGRGASPAVELCPLKADGTLAAPPRRVSEGDTFARRPALARGGDRYAVAWAASANADPNAVRPYAEYVDATGRALVDAAPLTEATPVYQVAAAHDGRSFAFAWQVPRGPHAIHFVRRDGAGHRVGEDRRLPLGEGAYSFFTPLVAATEGWLLLHDLRDTDRDRSTLVARWLAPDGAPVGELTVARFAGETHHVAVTTCGASHQLAWGEDGLFSARHDPRIARLDGRAVGVDPAPLGPRRSATPASVACNATGCTFVWVEVAPGAESPELFVERRDRDGVRKGLPLRVPSHGGASLWRAPVVAPSADGATQLVLMPMASGGGVLAQRLDAEGRLLGLAHVLPVR